MKVTTAIIAAALCSLAACRSHKAVERTVEEKMETVATDTTTFSRRVLAESGSDATIVAIDYFPPDTLGRQSVRRLTAVRRTAKATIATSDTATRMASRQEQRSAASTTAASPIRPCRWTLIALLGTALTLILLTLHKIKKQ